MEITKEHQPEVFQLGPIPPRAHSGDLPVSPAPSVCIMTCTGPHHIDSYQLDVGQPLREAGGLTQKQTWYRLAAGSLINGGKGGSDFSWIAGREEVLLCLCGGG